MALCSTPIFIACLSCSFCFLEPEPENEPKKSAETPINGSIPTNETPLDTIQASSDPAMKALSMTYQTLNLTAQALNERTSSFSESAPPEQNSNSTAVENDKKSQEINEKVATEESTCENKNLSKSDSNGKEVEMVSHAPVSDELCGSDKLEKKSRTESESEKASVNDPSTTQGSGE